MKSFRNQYMTSVVSALTTAKSSNFNAFKTCSINALNEDGDYVQARYDAAHTRALARLNALIAELTSNYAKEAELAGSRSGAYARKKNAAKGYVDATQFSELKRGFGVTSATYSERNAYFDGIVSASNQVVSLKNAADSQDDSLETQNESTLAATKSANETTRENAEAAADDAYAVTVENAWKDSYLAQLALGVTLKDAYELTATTFNSAIETAASDLRDAAFAAWDELDSEFEEYARVLNYQDIRANSGLTVPADAFDDPIFDFDVCFVAGTPILMADGTKKPIEEIQPGDLVLAADHLNPEESPAPARVVRTFDNGLKDVVRLKFEGDEEIVCTPSHRIYVSGRGWVCAEDLQIGDLCVSAEYEKVAFVERETLSEKARVLNFEVEGRHTYFVGCSRNLLVHNDCFKTIKEYVSTYTDELSRGLAQGVANLVNGVQDIAVETVNLAPLLANTVADLVDPGTYEPIRIPYVPSPDWSRGMFMEEATYGSIDTHKLSKVIGGESATHLIGLSASSLPRKFSRNGSVGGLIHRTSNSNLKVIETIKSEKETYYALGKSNTQKIYALKGKSIIPNWARGLLGNAEAGVEIPGEVGAYFQPIPPTGITKFLERINGGWVANARKLEWTVVNTSEIETPVYEVVVNNVELVTPKITAWDILDSGVGMTGWNLYNFWYVQKFDPQEVMEQIFLRYDYLLW